MADDATMMRDGLGSDRRSDLMRLGRRLVCEVLPQGLGAGPEAFDACCEIAGRAWMMGAEVALRTSAGDRACRICGCVQDAACDPPCFWVAADLCSACLLRV